MAKITDNLSPPKIVMVETSHPGNIGAAARAMKTMCLNELCLVQPKQHPDPVAFARASGAADILEQASLCDSLPQAITDCQIIVGITARSRKLSAPVFTPKQLVEKMFSDYAAQKVALVFGRERNGLTNEEIDLCNVVCTIPTNDEYGSLNIAAAIQVLCYEWYSSLQILQHQMSPAALTESLASGEEREGFYQHLWQALDKIDFADKKNPVPVQRKLRRLFDRVYLTSSEVNILRGILKNIIKQ